MGLFQQVTGVIADLRRGVRRLAADTRGNVAMIMGLIMPVLVLVSMAGVDIHRVATVRSNLQDALDAAALAAARSDFVKTDDLNRVGRAALRANLAGYSHVTLDDSKVTFTLNNNEVVVANATVSVKTIAAHIFLPPYGTILDEYLPVGAHSEVTRASKNIEVALVLDVTGSMASGGRMDALKTAAKNLIEIVVQPTAKQTPYYSRVAIIPYSIGVNAGTYANALRGPLTGPTSISNAQWAATAAVNISKVDKSTSPAKFTTTTNHGLAANDYVFITGIATVTGFNNKVYRVASASGTTFTLDGANNTSTSNGTGGTVRKCLRSDCTVIVTSNGHGLANGEYAYISGVGGMTALNNTTATNNWTIELINSNQFRVPLVAPQTTYTAGTGTTQCGRDGCLLRIFQRADSTVERVASSTCVSDRAPPAAYTDAAPGAGAWLGRLYPTGDPCSSRAVFPLSDQKSALNAEIDALQPTGSTAGQVGLAWGWYMLSPNFNGVWSGYTTGVHDPYRNLKAIILMTDGEFNTTYCQGVLANNANYDGDANQINCNATNGNPFLQTAQLCAEIKKARKTGDGQDAGPAIIIYTVGLSVSTSRGAAGIDTAREVLEACASTPDRAKFATNATQLNNAFEEFARDIARLRIAR